MVNSSNLIRDMYRYGFEVTAVSENSACKDLDLDVNCDYIVGADYKPFNNKVSPMSCVFHFSIY